MLIAQSLFEYGLIDTLSEVLYPLRVYLEDLARTREFVWVGIGMAVLAVWKLFSH